MLKLFDPANPAALVVGEVLTYEDMANPLTTYVVVGPATPYMDYAIDPADLRRTTVSAHHVDGPGGWARTGRIESPETVERLVADHAAEVDRHAAAELARLDDLRKLVEAGKAWVDANKPNGAKAVIVAELHVDESDSQMDYYGSRITTRKLLAWSKHTRDLFPEMRKAAAVFAGTSGLAIAGPDAEHREKYSMGGGYYLGHSRYSGWIVKKWKLDGYRSSDLDKLAADPAARELLETKKGVV